MNDKAMVVRQDESALAGKALANLLDTWVRAATAEPRKNDKMRDKANAVKDLVAATGVSPWFAVEMDILDWHIHMRLEGLESVTVIYSDGRTAERTEPLSESTIYKRHGDAANFWTWLKGHDEYGVYMPDANPFEHTRPKPPEPYKASKALHKEEINELLNQVRYEAETKLTARRDLAILYFFLRTGKRRAEVLNLRWGDIRRWNGETTVEFRVKGGESEVRVVKSKIHDVLLAYLEAAGRLEDMAQDTPLWTGHDRAGQATGALSSHAFAKNLKAYWRRAGLEGNAHIHALRHSVADTLYQKTGDIAAVQYQLGHKNQQTSRIYVHNIATKPDKFGHILDEEFGL